MGALAGGATVRAGNCAPTPTPMTNAIPITKVHCLTTIQPQTKDHSNKEWSGVDRFKNRTLRLQDKPYYIATASRPLSGH